MGGIYVKSGGVLIPAAKAALDTALEIESPTAEQIAEGRKRVDHCGSITPS